MLARAIFLIVSHVCSSAMGKGFATFLVTKGLRVLLRCNVIYLIFLLFIFTGINAVLGTDDSTFFHTSLSNELLRAHQVMVFFILVYQ